MARTASGSAYLEAARNLLKTARTADELRLAQSVLLPLELGLSLAQTARAIGRSRSATCTMRTRFCKVSAGQLDPLRQKRQLRNRAHADLLRESQILDEILAQPAGGEVLSIPAIKPAIEASLGKTVALSSVYRMLARHGWQKIPPAPLPALDASQGPGNGKKIATARWLKTGPEAAHAALPPA